MSDFAALPPAAAWRHLDARDGFEVAFFSTSAAEIVAAGSTSAVEAGQAWTVSYRLVLDRRWRTRRAEIAGHTAEGACRVALEHDGAGAWLVDGQPAPVLTGCLDVDLESSALTNALPVHRLGLGPGDAPEPADAPAAYVRARDLGVVRLDQTYRCVGARRYRYTAPAFGFRCELAYGAAGLVHTYPGIAVRAL